MAQRVATCTDDVGDAIIHWLLKDQRPILPVLGLLVLLHHIMPGPQPRMAPVCMEDLGLQLNCDRLCSMIEALAELGCGPLQQTAIWTELTEPAATGMQTVPSPDFTDSDR